MTERGEPLWEEKARDRNPASILDTTPVLGGRLKSSTGKQLEENWPTTDRICQPPDYLSVSFCPWLQLIALPFSEVSLFTGTPDSIHCSKEWSLFPDSSVHWIFPTITQLCCYFSTLEGYILCLNFYQKICRYLQKRILRIQIWNFLFLSSCTVLQILPFKFWLPLLHKTWSYQGHKWKGKPSMGAIVKKQTSIFHLYLNG